MKLFGALFIGITSGVAAVYLHLFAPPIGIILAIAGSFTAIWSVGRLYGKRIYKFIAIISWFAVFGRAAALGVGSEIFIQGDTLGNTFLLFSFFALFIALALPTN
jgi:hypothetical protein